MLRERIGHYFIALDGETVTHKFHFIAPRLFWTFIGA